MTSQVPDDAIRVFHMRELRKSDMLFSVSLDSFGELTIDRDIYVFIVLSEHYVSPDVYGKPHDTVDVLPIHSFDPTDVAPRTFSRSVKCSLSQDQHCALYRLPCKR